jgi:hypothetical protein
LFVPQSHIAQCFNPASNLSVEHVGQAGEYQRLKSQIDALEWMSAQGILVEEELARARVELQQFEQSLRGELCLGTADGQCDLFQETSATARSMTPTHLPTNGSTIYVRLYSRIAGALQLNSYTYIAPDPSR